LKNIIILFFFSVITYSQVKVDDSKSFNSTLNQINGKYYRTVSNSPSIVTINKGSEPDIQKIDLNEKMDIIIEFKEVPYLIRKKTDRNTDESVYLNRFFQLKNKLVEMEQNHLDKSNGIQLDETKINKEFYKLFFGVSATVSRGLLNELNKLNYVKKLHYNRKVEAFLDKGISITHIDSVWNRFGVDGDSIIIAIIDTGIDYLNPALGGGFGTGFKVIGGHDFENNDNNPIDDNGHGTHVAGIVAADGESILGVAPKASLIALKVLDSSGFGNEDNIIAAIEYCADPNGDGNTDDMVDIINLSLGSSSGNPTDPSSVAIDNASKLGITACIAAGNDYSYKSIGSPGTAKSAITVGASDDEDKLAFFSSKGPVNKTYSIKPDVVAPGVDINSLNLGGGNIEHSGTSMATPFVTGVCALLKSIHPNWRPEDFKSALMTTSIDIGEDVMSQGAGRINALEAAKVTTTISPSQLSFGIDNVEDLNWVVTDTITISNHSDEMQTYSFQKDFDYPGINIEFNPTSISINANESGTIIVELSVDNSVLAFPDWGSLSYDGNILIVGEENLHIPFAFTKAAKLLIVSDSPWPDIIIIGSNYSQPADFNDDMYEIEIVLPPNTYDIIASTFEYEKIEVLIKEEIKIADYKKVNLDFKNIENKVVYSGVDELGNTLEEPHRQFVLFPPATTPFISSSYSFPYDTLLFSDISNRYNLSFSESSVDFGSEQIARVIHHAVLEGISDNLLLRNDPNGFLRKDIEVKIPDGNGRLLMYNDGVMSRDLSRMGGFPIYSVEMESNIWRGELFLSEFKNDIYLSSIDFIASSGDNYDGYLTPLLLAWDGKILPYNDFKPSADVLLTNPNTPIVFGNSSIYCNGAFWNNFIENSNFIPWLTFFGPNQELFFNMENNSVLKVFDKNNNLVQSDTNTTREMQMLEKEYYRVEFSTSNYNINGLEGKLSLVSDFDLSVEDCTPPQITSFKILDQTRIFENHFEKEDSILVYFSSADFQHYLFDYSYSTIYNSVNSAKTELLARINGLEKWKPIESFVISEDSTIGFLYHADLSSYANLDSASIDLQLQFVDMIGNKTNWTITPAFTVGKTPIKTDIQDFEDKDIAHLFSYSLNANYPNPFNPSTILSYSIAKQGNVELRIFDVLGREVATVVNKNQKAGNYEVVFDASNLTSGIYFYRLQSGNFVDSKKMILLK